ncbi:MAG TPA: TonB-dependent receptor [Parvularcula sp.]|nr:TonB-dependent receptor [Parvularcula sp.]HBS34482.1 TonB-dependent receptor [Parvularcula sp.]
MARLRRLIRLSCALTSALSGVSALSILTATSASAQSQGLDEVTVTAQRREENQQEVPISITTLPEDRFTAILQGADDIRALATRVPGLYAESSNGRIAPRFYIRGLGNTDFDLAASQPVSIVMDEIVMENVVLKSFPLFDIERVEVLRGPQGTLFGRNTPAGIVKFDTVKPGDETEGYISGSIGRLTTAKVEGAIGLPLTDTLSVRASVLYQGRNDWVDNGAVLQNGFAGEEDAFGGFSDFAGRFQVAWSPTENFDALINFHGRKLEGTSELFRANIFSPGSNELNGNFDRGVVYYDQGGGNNQSYDTYGGSARLTLDLGAVDVISITGFETANGNSRGDIDGGSGAGFLPNGSFPGPILFQSDTKDAIDDHDQFTQEIRFASDYEGPFSWQAGFFYFNSDLTITTNPFFVAATTVRHDNESWALFAQGSYDLTDRLNFTGGVRYTEDDKDLIGVATNFPVAPVAVSDEKVTWDAALTFAATDAINFYARVARGFRAPTIQGRDVAFFGAPTTASSETVVSYEAGVKSTLFDNRMRFNASGWYYDANNLQFSAIGGLGNFNQLVNADGEAWGFEADAEWLVSENFLLTGGVGFADTEITEPGLAVAPCGGGCTVTDPLDGFGNALITGNPFPQAPKWTWNVTARYSVPTSKGELYLFTDWAGQSRTNFFLYESAEFFNDGSVEGGARLGLLANEGKLDVALYVRNILDEEIVRGGIDFNNLTGFVNEPRIWGAAATLKF